MNYQKKYPRKTKGNKDWLCKTHKSFKHEAAFKSKEKYKIDFYRGWV